VFLFKLQFILVLNKRAQSTFLSPCVCGLFVHYFVANCPQIVLGKVEAFNEPLNLLLAYTRNANNKHTTFFQRLQLMRN